MIDETGAARASDAASRSIDRLMSELQERRKELDCLYKIEEILNDPQIVFEEALQRVIETIPSGWQYPDLTGVKLTYLNRVLTTKNFKDTEWKLMYPIIVQEKEMGQIVVEYTNEMPASDVGPFLKEEKQLLQTIAERLRFFILHHNLKNVFHDLQKVRDALNKDAIGEWRIVVDMIRKTDPNLFMSILRKMLHQLCWKGVEEAELLLKQSSIDMRDEQGARSSEDENRPLRKKLINNYDEYIEAILGLANEYMNDDEILQRVQKWILEDKSSELVKALETEGTSLSEISHAIRKFYHLAPEKIELSPSTIKGLRVSLLRRFFTDELNFIRIAKEYVKLTDFYKLIDRMIFLPTSHGKLGGKSSGIFLASNILLKNEGNSDLLKNIKIPKSWYLTSDCILAFMQYNNLDEVLEQKYKEIDEVRMEYPHIVQVFKNSQFPPDIVKGLSVALDDLGETPIIVRSSSLLEDQLGAAFSGKYKSLFLANQGTKEQRLADLMDAIAEVYASTFGPDPIEYRAERGLLDFHEEMGIIIMEVVGKKVGKYFLPSYAGVAFSNNEFRWSPRIKREDGLLRLVPGLGTRAVDRVGDDYPVLVAPGQPNLSVNVSIDERVRYATKNIDVINLETNEFETIDIRQLIKDYGHEYPNINAIISIFENQMLRQPMGLEPDFEQDDLVVTFDGLLKGSKFIKQVDLILKTLKKKFDTPVDIEFASDGKDFYLLQCRPQSFSRQVTADAIPKNIPKENLLFTANKYISNGRVPDISHIVYVDPLAYSEIEEHSKLLQVGRVVGRLNKMLPKRKFILLGPGRWGSRGDIKLGVNVTYSDINNTSMLVEIARTKSGYVPDLSFGTHFFQDLVEASIRYLPLYPDDDEVFFNEDFFLNSPNSFKELLPEYGYLENVVHVIDVTKIKTGHVMRVLLNADQEEGVGILTPPDTKRETSVEYDESIEFIEYSQADQWRWRMAIAERIAHDLDAIKYGVLGLYVFGSTKNGTATARSDINLICHIEAHDRRKELLKHWFEGWSQCLGEINYLRTGARMERGMLDVHYITDEDIKIKTSYAAKINAPTNPAKPLPLKRKNWQ